MNWKQNYVKNVYIISDSSSENLCENPTFLKELFRNGVNTNQIKRVMKKVVQLLPHGKKESFENPDWVVCEKKCYKNVYELIKKEMNSTVYILRAISNSVFQYNKNSRLKFKYNGERLTGLWKSDSSKFDIEISQMYQPRLIFGFGPSASGKTYWAKQLIELFNQKYKKTFPKLFISIDGGIYRDYSEVYQSILYYLKRNNIGGFSNLVTAGLSSTKSLFKANKIKKTVIRYLIEQKKRGNHVSLYVPITLGKCMISFCKKYYKQYIKITGDKEWIGTMIYQCKQGRHLCKYKQEYRCIGTTESGKNREFESGKKYSSHAYNNSMKKGMIAFQKSKFCRLLIHNSGGMKFKDNHNQEKFSKSIITEFPIHGKYKFDKIPKKYNCRYIRHENYKHKF